MSCGALVCAAAAAVVVGSGAFASPGDAWRDKVDGSVLTAAAAGPTEFFVALEQKANLAGATALATRPEKARYVYEQLTSVAAQSQGPLLADLRAAGVQARSFWITNGVLVTGDSELLQTIASRPEVSHVYANPSGKLDPPIRVSAAGDSMRTRSVVTAVEPNLVRVRADQVWALGYTGQGAVVAGADTGVFWEHNALKSKYRGWNGASASHDYNWHDAVHHPNTGCPGSSPVPCDDDELLGGGHGTHTMGTVVGDDGGANKIGMAPGARWMACRNMNNGVGEGIAGYLECMEWFIAPTKIDGTAPDPSKSPDVINNSWGCVEACPPPLLQDTLQASRAAGIFYSVSAGNEGPECNTLQFPLARYPEAFTVGSTTWTTDTISDFSSRGPVLGDPNAPNGLRKPDISAPGSNVRSSVRDGTYDNLSGTSMASPHVTGLVALIISAKPSLAGNVGQIEDIIEQTAVPKTTTEGCGGDSATAVPNNTYGFGRIDALAAVQKALQVPTAVGVVRFSARLTKRGVVSLAWRTGSEQQLAGFDVFRRGVKVNRTLIAAKNGGRARGANYQFVDRFGSTRSTYRLRLVDLNGKRSWFGKSVRPVR